MKSGRKIYGRLVSFVSAKWPGEIATLKRGELADLAGFLATASETELRDELLALVMCEVFQRFLAKQKRKARKVL